MPKTITQKTIDDCLDGAALQVGAEVRPKSCSIAAMSATAQALQETTGWRTR